MCFEDFLQWNNILLKFSKIPGHMNGFAYYNGISYLIILNPSCSNIQQQNTLVHEIVHIFENHFSYPIEHEERCEQEVKFIIKEIKENYINY